MCPTRSEGVPLLICPSALLSDVVMCTLSRCSPPISHLTLVLLSYPRVARYVPGQQNHKTNTTSTLGHHTPVQNGKGEGEQCVPASKWVASRPGVATIAVASSSSYGVDELRTELIQFVWRCLSFTRSRRTREIGFAPRFCPKIYGSFFHSYMIQVVLIFRFNVVFFRTW